MFYKHIEITSSTKSQHYKRKVEEMIEICQTCNWVEAWCIAQLEESVVLLLMLANSVKTSQWFPFMLCFKIQDLPIMWETCHCHPYVGRLSLKISKTEFLMGSVKDCTKTQHAKGGQSDPFHSRYKPVGARWPSFWGWSKVLPWIRWKLQLIKWVEFQHFFFFCLGICIKIKKNWNVNFL